MDSLSVGLEVLPYSEREEKVGIIGESEPLPGWRDPRSGRYNLVAGGRSRRYIPRVLVGERFLKGTQAMKSLTIGVLAGLILNGVMVAQTTDAPKKKTDQETVWVMTYTKGGG